MVTTRKFRFDINGLRAYAVVLVVLYHFQIYGFKGGFVGVDIFFVISGYLMTKIIITQISEERFSPLRFYLARGIRIIPALLVLTSAVGTIGWFLLIPEMYKAYGKDAAASVTFLSNVSYLREASGYFTTNAHEKLLLHTWSLSVEWQFYILLPIILLIIYKIFKRLSALKAMLIVGTALSLFLSYKISQSNASAAFYMIPTRAWEMLAGGLVFAYFDNLKFSSYIKKGFEIVGFSLILISLIIFDSKTLWPSFNALLPVLGSALILIANLQNSFLTKPKIFQWLGTSSYSIYLWHWPIVVFAGDLGHKTNAIAMFLGVMASLVLGWLSYKFVENPTKKHFAKVSVIKAYVVLVVLTVGFGAVFAFIFLKDGIPQRASEDYIAKTKEMVMPLPSNGWCFYDVDNISSLKVGADGTICQLGSKTPTAKRALLFGDSFAGQNIPFWDEIGQQLNTQVQAISTNWCYPALNDDFPGSNKLRSYQQCIYNRRYLAENLQKNDYIIFAGFWKNIIAKNELHNFKTVLDLAAKLNIPVIIMPAPFSYNENVGGKYKESIWMGKQFKLDKNIIYDKESSIANEQVKMLASHYPNVLFLSREDLYPQNNLTKDGRPYSLDGTHISILGSKASAIYFENTPKFQQLKEKFR